MLKIKEKLKKNSLQFSILFLFKILSGFIQSILNSFLDTIHR